MARTETRDAGSRFGLWMDRRVRDDLREEECGGIERELVVLDGIDGPGIHRALHWSSIDLGASEHCLHHLNGHHAVMLAMAAAADGQVRVWVAAERKQGRNQRSAEQKEQGSGNDAPHTTSVYKFAAHNTVRWR